MSVLTQCSTAAAGDTLFALGCGRLFEGDPKTMWSSLSKLLPLPADTLVYCAHEYTQSNARFAVSVDPNNTALQERKKRIDDARSKVSCTAGTVHCKRDQGYHNCCSNCFLPVVMQPNDAAGYRILHHLFCW